MKKKVSALVLFTAMLALVAGATAAGPASAQGPPTVAPLEAVCTAAVACSSATHSRRPGQCAIATSTPAWLSSEPYISAARQLCLNGYNADFFVVSGPPGFPTWNCGFLP